MINVKLFKLMLNAHGGDTQLVSPTSSVQLERKSGGEAEESERARVCLIYHENAATANGL